jgi:cytosine/adenosine deaminase-related metal-dependent hydrolase
MDHPSQATLLKASMILPIEGLPISNGALVLKEGLIEACLTQSELARWEGSALVPMPVPVIDFGEAIISPGLINLHTHLEYSLLKARHTSLSFFPWVKSLQEVSRVWNEDTWRLSAELGVKAARDAGTTLIVDNSYCGASASAIAKAGLKALIGLEVFGVNQQTASDQWSKWLEKLAHVQVKADPELSKAIFEKRIQFTVATHAPYTVCPALWSFAQAWAADHDRIVLAHVAETGNECQWICGHDGEIDAFLASSFGSIPSYKGDPILCSKAWRKGGQSSVEHLDSYHLLDQKLLVAHAVHVNDPDVSILAERGVAIAHCPRSNSRLRNGCAPVGLFRQYNLTFGLGTDSLASVEDLNLLSEAQFTVALQRTLDRDSTFNARQALEAVTIGAARAIHLDSEIGSLAKGKRADLAIFSLPEGLSASDLATKYDPYELLVHGQCKLNSLFVDGKQIHGERVREAPATRSAPAFDPAKR